MISKGKRIYLCRPNHEPVTVLNGVKTETVNYNKHTKDFDQLTFEVDEYITIDGKQIKSNGYDLLDVYLKLYLENVGYFQMQHPTDKNDGKKGSKSIVAYSIEKEFMDTDWKGLKINTGETDSLEQLAENNVNELGFAKEFITFYRPNRKDLSFIHLVLSKMPGWSVIDEDIDPLLWDKKMSVDQENINLYALLTSIVAPQLECIFLFDTINRRIKAISKQSLNDAKYDTNIFIGYRNLANSINIEVNEDSVYTRFYCTGSEELNFNNWNYNSSRIIDLSYFMRDPYMSDELVAKVKTWINWKDTHRNEFADLSRSRADLNDKIYDIKYRVPNDGDDWEQWDKMDEDLLKENLGYYEALLTSLQVSVDTSPQYDSDENYIPWKKVDGTVDHDRYLKLLYDLANGYGGYYTYIEIQNYIIPNIQIALENLTIPIDDDKKDYVKDFETNWELYGIEELSSKKKDYENRLNVLKGFAKPWNLMTDEEKSGYVGGEEEYNTLGRSEYIKISGYLGSETTSGSLLFQLKKLNDELAELQASLSDIDKQRTALVEQSDMNHPSYGFTADDIVAIESLLIDTDYQNENILSTSIDTTVSKIDKEKELFDDSVSKLFEVSQPQLQFTTDMDNLLALPEFAVWKDDFELLNFIRLGIKDDYSVKLRLVGYSYNPCEISSNLTVEFSNMITSRSGRTDLTDILNSENNRGSKNSISIGTGNSESDKEYMTALLQMMVKTQLFKNSVGNISSNNTALLDEAEVNRLIGQYAKFMTIDVGKITGDEASFKKMFADYIGSDYIVSNSANFKELDAYIAKLQQAIIGTSSTETGIIFNLTSSNATIDELFVKNEIAKHISVGDLKAGNIVLTNNMQILSENGKMVMNGNAMQIKGTDNNGKEYVGIQIGYDTTNKPSIIVRDENGVAIFTSSGITKDAIADGLIINNMVADSTLSKDKLNFDVVEGDGNGNLNAAKVIINGHGIDAEFTTISENITKVDGRVTTLESKISSIELEGEQIFKEVEGKISPEFITISAVCKNGATVANWYIDEVLNTEYVSQDKMSITIPSSFMAEKDTVVIKVSDSTENLYDIHTLYRLTDLVGETGRAAVSVIISSEKGITFEEDTEITKTVCTCTVYEGITEVMPLWYKWQIIDNDTGDWVTVGTERTLTVDIDKSIIRKRVRCLIEIIDTENASLVDENEIELANEEGIALFSTEDVTTLDEQGRKNIIDVETASALGSDDSIYINDSGKLKQINYDTLASAILNKLSSHKYSTLNNMTVIDAIKSVIDITHTEITSAEIAEILQNS